MKIQEKSAYYVYNSKVTQTEKISLIRTYYIWYLWLNQRIKLNRNFPVKNVVEFYG